MRVIEFSSSSFLLFVPKIKQRELANKPSSPPKPFFCYSQKKELFLLFPPFQNFNVLAFLNILFFIMFLDMMSKCITKSTLEKVERLII